MSWIKMQKKIPKHSVFIILKFKDDNALQQAISSDNYGKAFSILSQIGFDFNGKLESQTHTEET